MNGADLAYLFNWSYRAIKMNLDGITHEESLVMPQPAGNSLNWVLGHVLEYRQSMLELLGEPALWEAADRQSYGRGSKPGGKALPFERLLADLDLSQERLDAALNRVSGEKLAEPARQARGTVGERLTFGQFHESYHCGQTGLLRRLIGKPGAIQ